MKTDKAMVGNATVPEDKLPIQWKLYTDRGCWEIEVIYSVHNQSSSRPMRSSFRGRKSDKPETPGQLRAAINKIEEKLDKLFEVK